MRKEVTSHFLHNDLPGGNSALEPPDPIPNSEVKRRSADDSVGSPHVKVGHCQALNSKSPDCLLTVWAFFFSARRNLGVTTKGQHVKV